MIWPLLRLGQKSRKFFRCYFGTNDYFIRTFWNYLTFKVFCGTDVNGNFRIQVTFSKSEISNSDFSFIFFQDWTYTSLIALLKKSGPLHKLCPIQAILLHIRIIIVGMALLARPLVKQFHPYKRKNTGKNWFFFSRQYRTSQL